MKNVIRAAIRNSPAMNTLMVGILVVGMVCFANMRREVFPEFQLEIVLISVPYPGASPSEIEEGICQKIEEAVQTIEGIKKMTSVAQENSGSVVLELQANVKDVQKVVTEVRSQVDRIPSFPELAEDPEVQQITFRSSVMKVSVMAPESENGEFNALELREMAERVRDDLLALPSVSNVEIEGGQNYQIDIEIDEQTLRKHGLSLNQVADIVRAENLEVPAGTIRSDGQEILIRGNNKRLVGSEIAKLPLVTAPNGVVLTIGDLGTVRDEFEDISAITKTNRRPSLVLKVQRTSDEDLLRITDEVSEYASRAKLPNGYSTVSWADQSTEVRDRLKMLNENGLMGLALVFLVLALFLELRLAFWVALGIPVSILGAGGILFAADQTLNILSTFSFLMALGIIVDDAIVVGENVYSHRQLGKNFIRAAVDGTYEVMPSVVASVTTTIIAFCPLLFVSGVMGKFIGVMPLAVIAMLIVSLLESLLILPCHLAHGESIVFKVIGFLFFPLRFLTSFLQAVNRRTQRGLEIFIDSVYTPILKWSLAHRAIVMTGAATILLWTIGFVAGGFVQFVIFPKEDSPSLRATVRFPDGTPERFADEATQEMEELFREIDKEYGGIAEVYHRSVGLINSVSGPFSGSSSGSHVGMVEVELVESSERDVTSIELVSRWRERVGTIPGVENLTFGTTAHGPGGTPIEFKLLAKAGSEDALEAAVEATKAELRKFDGVFDVADDSQLGKWEFQVSIKDRAKSMGVKTKDLADTIRASFYGAEVMRLQRGRHEVKLMVRYPPEQRRSLAELDEIRIRTGDGHERPITELADVSVVRGYSEINRLDQKRSITITADVDEDVANASETVAKMRSGFIKQLLADNPGLMVSWEGQQEQTRESLQSLFRGTGIAIIVMYALLTFQFKSYLQPLIILMIVPFGAIGAILGHGLLGIPLQLFSFFGMVALTGVVVNDSIVLIDFINARERAGATPEEAVIEAGRRRFRPVLLTSATTIAGLIPILLETSLQAIILIPMATSLSCGLFIATTLILLMVPTMFCIYRSVFPYHRSDDEDYLYADNVEKAAIPVKHEQPIASGQA